jgi:hypothetical protein
MTENDGGGVHMLADSRDEAISAGGSFAPFKMVSEDPLRYQLRLGTSEAAFRKMREHLRQLGWIEESDGIWAPPDGAEGQHRA